MNAGQVAGSVGRALADATFPEALKGKRVTVVIPDETRPLPLAEVLQEVLTALSGAQVRVLVGLGLHRPMSEAQMKPLQDVCGIHGAQIEQHSPDNPMAMITACTNVGGLCRPLPAAIHHAVVEAEARVLVGIVEPHQYAGFSGGAKAVSIGCAGPATISGLHSLELLKDPGTRLGSIEDNHFQAALWRIFGNLDSTFGVQVVPSDPVQTFAGPLQSTFRDACKLASRSLFEDYDETYPAVVTQVPTAKAASFYQASRAATYVMAVDAPVLDPGGAMIIEAACPEGLGSGAGEIAFAEALLEGPTQLLEALEAGTRTLRGGEQRAYVLARALSKFRMALVGAPFMPALAPFGVVQAASLKEATDSLGLSSEPRRLSDVFHRVPRYRGDQL